MMLSPRDAWQATLGQLQVQLNRGTFDTWLKGSDLLAYEDGEFIIRVRHAYAKDWLEKHLDHQITQTLSSIFGRTVRVNYVVMLPSQTVQAQPGTLFPTPEIAAPVSKPEPVSLETGFLSALDLLGARPAEPDYSEWDPRLAHLAGPAPDLDEAYHPPLDRRFTFESFVTGPCNQFASAAAQAVAHTPGTTYNPLVIYGGVGLGKTHLLHAIGHVGQSLGKHVIFVTGEDFTNEMVAAIRNKTTEQLRDHYRRADVLLVDDVQFIAGKPSTEEEFYHTFNAVISRGGQVVVVCNQHPRGLEKLDDRLRSRLEGGLLADIQAPEYETRLKILYTKSAAQGIILPDDVAQLLAHHVTDNVRELEGLLTQVLARTTLSKQPLTVALVQHVLNIHTSQPMMRRTASVERILEATATFHQLSMDDLLSKRRTKDVVRARHIAMYLAREETEASLPQIGAAMGGRNHSTVLHGYQKIAGEVEADEALREEVSAIRRQLYLFPSN